MKVTTREIENNENLKKEVLEKISKGEMKWNDIENEPFNEGVFIRQLGETLEGGED